MTRAGRVLVAAMDERALRLPVVTVGRGCHVEPRDVAVEPRVSHEVAARRADHARRLHAEIVALAGGADVDRHARTTPPSPGFPDRLEDAPGLAVVARVPHAQRAIVLL